MRIALVAHPKKRAALSAARDLVDMASTLASNGSDIELILDEGLPKAIGRDDALEQGLKEMIVEAVICIGGDGTLLRTMQLTTAPVLGLNAGSLGFLMEPYPNDIRTLLEGLIEKRYFIEERTKLSTILNGERLPDAVNEAVVMTRTPSKIQDFLVSVDNEQGLAIRSDGVIISTPTGSTSYALSAGGSIMDPRLEAFEIVPIAPFRVNVRPLIVPDTSRVTLRVANRSRAAIVTMDGNFRARISHRDKLEFGRSNTKAKFIRFERDYYSRLNEKILNYVHG